jgi:hypothetical protein
MIIFVCDFLSADENHIVQTKYSRRANESHNQCRRKLKVTGPRRCARMPDYVNVAAARRKNAAPGRARTALPRGRWCDGR